MTDLNASGTRIPVLPLATETVKLPPAANAVLLLMLDTMTRERAEWAKRQAPEGEDNADFDQEEADTAVEILDRYIKMIGDRPGGLLELPAAVQGLIDAAEAAAGTVDEVASAIMLARLATISPPAVDSPIRVAVGVSGGLVQWTLADRPGALVTVLDFDVENGDDFDQRLIDDGTSKDPAFVATETPDIDPAYFERLDAAPLCNMDGDVYGDCDEDQVADEKKWLVTAEIGILGPDGGTDSYSGFVPADDAPEAIARGLAIIHRRHAETGVKVWTIKALAPAAAKMEG